MKTIYTFILILTILCVSLNGESWKNSLKPTGKTKTVILTQNNESNYNIIIPAEPNEYEIKASDALKKYFKKIYSIDLHILKENEVNNKNFISLGNTKLLEKSDLSQDIIFNEDGYAIKEKDNNIYIFGGVWTGPLNGVYALLEEDLGCRFWTKLHDDTIPTVKNGKLTFSPRVFNPRFITRAPTNNEMSDGLFIEQNRLRSYDAYGFCHTSFNYVSVHDYENNPDQFSMRDGKRYPEQLCWSNPTNIDILEICVRQHASQGVKRINISPMDGIPLCDCPICNALDKPEGTKAASYIKALNTVCERIEKDYPDVKIFALAYLDYVTPPKTIKPHKNLTVQICSDSSDWPWPFCTYDETGKFANDVNAWVNSGADTLTWNYVTNFDHYLLPNPNIKSVSDNIRLLDKYGVGGVFLQGNCYPTAVCASGYLKTWVWGKLLIHPELNYKNLMKDFIYGYYGECAKEIEEYENSLIELREKAHKIPHNPNTQAKVEIVDGLATVVAEEFKGKGVDVGGIRWTPDASIYTDEFVENSMKLMDKALKKAKTEEMKNKIKYMRLGPIYLKLGREVGYFKGAGKWIHKDFDNSKKDYYLSLVNEIDDTLTELGVKTVAETIPWDGNKDTYINKWRDILTLDSSDITKISIENAGWIFQRDENKEGVNKGFYQVDYDTGNWSNIEVGKEWDLQGIETLESYGWYKKNINISNEILNSENVYLVCAGSDEEAIVYINGKLVLEHTLEKLNLKNYELYVTPWAVDIKPFLQTGENQICIIVGNTKGYGGLYNPVFLVTTQKNNTKEDIFKKVF